MLVTLFGIVTLHKLSQFRNAALPMPVTPFSMIILFTSEQLPPHGLFRYPQIS